MPSSEWSDIEVGDRIQVVFEDSDLYRREGTVTEIGLYGVRVAIDGAEGENGFSYRSSLKKLSGRLPKRPISPVFYSLKETN